MCTVAGLLASSPARAQNEDVGSWRRSQRPPESPQRFAVELRFGQYHPNVDDDFPAARVKPFEGAFGPDRKPFYFGFEVDYQILRLWRLGTLGVGGGWGFSSTSANAIVRRTGDPSASDTSLSIMPMYGVGVFRLDYLARETVIPLVAYGKAGLGYGLWWMSTEPDPSIKGHTWGTHFALGGMLMLDALDEHASVELDNEWGINATYFFFEWMFANLNGFNNPGDHSIMNIGTSTWVLGLALEL